MTTTTISTEPTFSRIPAGGEDAGEECLTVARAYGVPLDEWQADVIRAALRESGGTWSASQVGLVLGRQNGKGQIILAVELYGLLVLRENIFHTSHAVKTSSDAFRRLWAVLQSHDDLKKMVRRHSQMIGAEYVELDNGARIAFSTRSSSAGRGLSVDRLIVDEAEDLPAPEVAALQPTTFSRPHAQAWYVGTAPGVMHDSEAFATMRRSAHDGLNPRLCWIEWCATWGADPDDRDLWVRVNPSVACGRVDVKAIEDDRSVLPVDTFKAERLSMWVPEGTSNDTVFDIATWDALADPNSAPASDVAVGVDTPPSRDATTVCVAGRRSDGLIHLEWYTTQDGMTWAPGWVAARLAPGIRAVVIDDRSPLTTLDWRSEKVRPTPATTRDVADAAGRLWDAVTDGRLRHRAQVELTRAALGAKQRPMMGGAAFGWERRAPGSSVLIAASLALFGVECERPLRPSLNASRRRVVVR